MTLALHIITSLSAVDGGPPTALRSLIAASLETDYRIEVVCLDDPNDPLLKDLPCPVHALGKSFSGRYSFSLRLWSWLGQNASRFEALIVHGIWTFPAIAARVMGRRFGKPLAIFTHGQLDPWFSRAHPVKHVKKMLYWPVLYPVLRDALAVIFTATSERDLAKASFRPNRWNSVVMPYGITDPEWTGSDPSAQIEAFFHKLPELRGRRYLLFLARLHPKKGCDMLIEVFARLAPSIPDVDLVVAGPDQGGMLAKLQRLAGQLGISERIWWPGMIEGDVKWGALRSCDAFVLPSHSENFGVAVVEALAVGRPVLISNQVNIWQEIESDGAGLVEDDTTEGTERLLRRWFCLTPADRDGMVLRARPSFQNRFVMKQTAFALSSLIRSASTPGSVGGGNLASTDQRATR